MQTFEFILYMHFKHTGLFTFLVFSIWNKNVRLSNCRTIEQSDHRYAPDINGVTIGGVFHSRTRDNIH